ncbi:hypothetical protein BDV26DRAFT_258953 [Aspergillus bertholletiae]|uniref:Uncharacterized protein n=1 Tax=Aspergillus bertholletiae TaxID=1226010 RepID=A0A5N7BD20_9EURO|nr:hypothetical protein BDV26DRAFT_258953 [Aspergillus bertholletiae]
MPVTIFVHNNEINDDGILGHKEAKKVVYGPLNLLRVCTTPNLVSYISSFLLIVPMFGFSGPRKSGRATMESTAIKFPVYVEPKQFYCGVQLQRLLRYTIFGLMIRTTFSSVSGVGLDLGKRGQGGTRQCLPTGGSDGTARRY